MASKGPRSKLDHETRAKRQKVSCEFFNLEDYLLPIFLVLFPGSVFSMDFTKKMVFLCAFG